jgi:beta-mannosidase
VRFFQRGANYLSEQLLSNMTPERYRVDVDLLREANLNTVHPFAVIERQAFYDACDAAGVLVYQDFPMWLAMRNDSDLVRRATAQLHELIEQFGHHPCIGVWNFGSQPSAANFRKLCSGLAETARALDAGRIVHQANALIEPQQGIYDPVRDYKWSTATAEVFHDKYDWRRDTHQYQGWYWGAVETLQNVPIKYLELVTEYGAQSLPDLDILRRFIPPEALDPPRWPQYARHCFQPEYQFLFIDETADLPDLVAASQAYQAHVIRYHTEYYRRHKFAPCNGAHLFCFNDCWPAITWSVVDFWRNRKAGFYALQRAMAPLQVMVEFEQQPELSPAGASLWLVNDFPRPYDDLRLTWTVSDSSGAVVDSGELACTIAANAIANLGDAPWSRPARAGLRVSLGLWHGTLRLSENDYLLGE